MGIPTQIEGAPMEPVVVTTEQFSEVPGPFEQMLRRTEGILNTHHTSHQQTDRAKNPVINLLRQFDTAPHQYEVVLDETAQDEAGEFKAKWTGVTDSTLRATRFDTWVKPKFDKVTFSGIEFGGGQIDVILVQDSKGTAIKTSTPVDRADAGKVVGALKTHIDRVGNYFGKQQPKRALFRLAKSG